MARRAATALLFGSILLASGGAATREPAPPSAAPEAAAATPDAAVEREWKVDQTGQRYYTERLAKAPGYGTVENGKLTTPWGIVVEVSGEDDSYYYVRVYDRSDLAMPSTLKTWTAEEQAAIAASYPPALDAMASSRRLVFEPFDQGLPRRGQWRNGFRLADLNGDGALDLVHGPARKQLGQPLVFLGDKRGNWRRWTEASFPAFPYDYGDVAVADFDGNGTLDLALAVHLRGVVVLANDGKSGFSLRSDGIPFQHSAAEPVAFSSRTIVAADWDRDGLVDVLAGGDGPRMAGEPGGATSYGVAWYRNRGDGSWERRGDHPTSEIFGESLALGDLDGDGDVDLAAASSVSGAKQLLVLSQGESRWSRAELPTARAGFSQAVGAGDFDGNGKLDLALTYQTYEGGAWRAGIDLHLRRADGSWERRGLFAEPGLDRLLALGVGDLDGDGRPDLAAATSSGRVIVLRNDGAAFTREDTHLTEPNDGCGGYHVEIADLDGDGRGDLAVGFAGEDTRPPHELAQESSQPRGCPNEGALRVWRTAVAESAARAAGAPDSR